MTIHLATSPEVRGRLPACASFVRIVDKSHRNGSPEDSSSIQQATSTHILDDDSLLNIFSYYWLTAFDYHEFDDLFSRQ